MGDHREGQGAANGATLLGSGGFCTAVAVSLMEEEKTQAEKHNGPFMNPSVMYRRADS